MQMLKGSGKSPRSAKRTAVEGQQTFSIIRAPRKYSMSWFSKHAIYSFNDQIGSPEDRLQRLPRGCRSFMEDRIHYNGTTKKRFSTVWDTCNISIIPIIDTVDCMQWTLFSFSCSRVHIYSSFGKREREAKMLPGCEPGQQLLWLFCAYMHLLCAKVVIWNLNGRCFHPRNASQSSGYETQVYSKWALENLTTNVSILANRLYFDSYNELLFLA